MTKLTSSLIRCFVVGGLLLAHQSASAWGFFVHRISPQLAAYYLPKKIQGFFHKNLDNLVYNSVRPDVRRNTDPTEAPRHYIDFEAYGDSAAWRIPERFEAAVARYTLDTLNKYGTVPWRVEAMQQKLTEAMRAGNKDSILYYAAEVCHYVGDSHVPLHTSLNYDGQLSNQRGIHALWESTLPEMDIQEYQLYRKHKPRYLKDPQHAIWEVLRTTHVLVKDVFEEERKASEGFAQSEKYNTKTGRNGKPYQSYSGVFARRYSQRLATSVQEQVVKTAQTLSDFWYTCWVNAGKPDLSDLQPLSKADKQQLKTERKAWKNNGLLAENLLKARKED
jgi:hypothetical protein